MNDTALLQSIREMVARDWNLPERLRVKRAAAEFRVHGAAGALAISDALRSHAQIVRGSDPSAESRRADLAAHVCLHALLERASLGLRRR